MDILTFFIKLFIDAQSSERNRDAGNNGHTVKILDSTPSLKPGKILIDTLAL